MDRGIEPRDLVAYPLPPNASLARVDVVVRELQREGHAARYEWLRETLVDWTATHRHRQHEGDAVVLHYVAGGIACRVWCDGREIRLVPAHLRLSREQLKHQLLGRP